MQQKLQITGVREHCRTNSSVRVARLDALRGVAILLVLGRHQEITRFWTESGWAGVDLFFVLSGFLIAGLIFRQYARERSVDLIHFWGRRALRIYPPFLSMLAGSILLNAIVNHRMYSQTSRILAELTWTQSYQHGIWGHTWSLAVEEHFYILLPLFLAWLIYRNCDRLDPFQSLPRAVLGLNVSILLLRTLATAWWPFEHMTHVFPTHLRLDSLAFGVLLSYLYYFRNESLMSFASRRRALLIAGVTFFSTTLLWPLESPVMHTIGFTFVYLGSGCLLLLAIYNPEEPSRAVRILAWIGGYSYSIYLWHMAVAQYTPLFTRIVGLGSSHPARIAVYLAGSLIAGVVMHWVTELPALRLREHLIPVTGRSGV